MRVQYYFFQGGEARCRDACDSGWAAWEGLGRSGRGCWCRCGEHRNWRTYWQHRHFDAPAPQARRFPLTTNGRLKPYFEGINVEPKLEAIGLAKELIEAESGPFEPKKISDKYAEALRELLRAKVEQRAPQIEVATEGKASEVINIMAALKESMQAKGRAKVRDAVRRRMGKTSEKEKLRPRASRPRPSPRRTAH